MPVLRYFLVMGCSLLGLLFVVDYLVPKEAAPAKSVAKTPSRPKSVARADRHDRPNYAAAYPPAPVAQFGGYRQAQYDRPFGGGFFNFRMF